MLQSWNEKKSTSYLHTKKKSMRKLKALCALLLCTGASLAAQDLQQPPLPNPIIPARGNVMLEFNFKPFGNDKLISFDNFQGKWRTSDHVALRLGLQVNQLKNELTKWDYDNRELYPSTYREKSFGYGVMPGIEYHFLKNNRISPYLGVELTYKKLKSSSMYENYTSNYNSSNTYQKYDVEGGWMNVENYTFTYNGQVYTGTSTSYDKNRSNHSIGTNLLLGSDFYLLKNMYLGFEIGLGYDNQQYEKVTIHMTNTVNSTVYPSYKMSSLRFIYNNSLRLGIWF